MTTREVPGSIWLSGEAPTNMTLLGALDGRPFPLQRQEGGRFFGEATADNSASPIFSRVSIAGKEGGVLTDLETGHRYLARTPEVFIYDADGNLLSDGRWTNTWDCESRLIAMESLATVQDTAKMRVEFGYDYQGRRVQKVVFQWNGSQYTAQSTNRFVYDGMLPIAIINSAAQVSASFVWGEDSSGTMQEMGGAGALLSMTRQIGPMSGSYFYSYDGNGNVGRIVTATNGNVAAEYEYGPFGELNRATGPLAKANPFRFSTKYHDDETGLTYYGYRYYSSSTGKWLSRDPLEEDGGPNLQSFVLNNPQSFYDPFGDSAKSVIMAPVTAFRRVVGLPFSFLSGDIFDKNGIVTDLPKDRCGFLITINGVRTPDPKASELNERAANAPAYRDAYPIQVRNRTHFWGLGDVLEIVGNEVGGIDVTAARAARQINLAAKALKKNGCCCGSIQVLAHSQGAMVFNRALPMINDETRKLICYTGIGGEKAIVRNSGLQSVENAGNRHDWVPVIGNYNPLRLLDIPQLVNGFDFNHTESPEPAWLEHGFKPHYTNFVQQLPNNCKCITIK